MAKFEKANGSMKKKKILLAAVAVVGGKEKSEFRAVVVGTAEMRSAEEGVIVAAAVVDKGLARIETSTMSYFGKIVVEASFLSKERLLKTMMMLKMKRGEKKIQGSPIVDDDVVGTGWEKSKRN